MDAEDGAEEDAEEDAEEETEEDAEEDAEADAEDGAEEDAEEDAEEETEEDAEEDAEDGAEEDAEEDAEETLIRLFACFSINSLIFCFMCRDDSGRRNEYRTKVQTKGILVIVLSTKQLHSLLFPFVNS